MLSARYTPFGKPSALSASRATEARATYEYRLDTVMNESGIDRTEHPPAFTATLNVLKGAMAAMDKLKAKNSRELLGAHAGGVKVYVQNYFGPKSKAKPNKTSAWFSWQGKSSVRSLKQLAPIIHATFKAEMHAPANEKRRDDGRRATPHWSTY